MTMAEDGASASRKNLLCSLDKFYFDNYLNLDEKLSLNDNFNQNRYAETQRHIMRNVRKMNTEPPKKVCEDEKEQSNIYPSFFQRIFKSISQNISHTDSKKSTNDNKKEDKSIKKQKTFIPFILQKNQKENIKNEDPCDKSSNKNTLVKDSDIATDVVNKTKQSEDVDEENKEKETYIKKGINKEIESRRKTEMEDMNKKDDANEKEKVGNENENEIESGTKMGIENQEDTKEDTKEVDAVTFKGDTSNNDLKNKEKGSLLWGKRKNTKTNKENVKAKSEESCSKEENRNIKETAVNEVISNVFKKKSVKSLVVRDTGGIDIEIIETENPEYLYYTHSGTLVSNIYYEFDDSLRNKEMYHEKNVKKVDIICSQNDENGKENTRMKKSDRNDEHYNAVTKINDGEKIVGRSKEVSKYYTNQKSSNENILTGNEKQLNKHKQNDVNANFSKKPSSESTKAPELLSSFSSTSLNVFSNRRRKKYYYFGETYNNKRNGWGMLIFNDRVIFEGEYKMNNALGYFIKYNEYSTEFGYRSPICIQSVSIMSDNDNFIIQNKFNYYDSDKEDENEMETQPAAITVAETEKKETEKKETERKEIEKKETERKETERKETERKEMEKKETEKMIVGTDGIKELPKQKHKQHNATFTTVKDDSNMKNIPDTLHNKEINMKNLCSWKPNQFNTENISPKKEIQRCQSLKEKKDRGDEAKLEIDPNKNIDEENDDDNDSDGNENNINISNPGDMQSATKSKSLYVSTNPLRRNSKHKTSPARSIHYLKPPVINVLKNDCYLNKQSPAKSVKPVIRRSYKCKTTHLVTPINIIVTSMDTDNEDVPVGTEKENEKNEKNEREETNEDLDVTHEVSTNDINPYSRSITGSVSRSMSEYASQNDTSDDKEKRQAFGMQSDEVAVRESKNVLNDVISELKNKEISYEEVSDEDRKSKRVEKEDGEGKKKENVVNIKKKRDVKKSTSDSNVFNKSGKNKTGVIKGYTKFTSFSLEMEKTKENVKQKHKKINFVNNDAKENIDSFVPNEEKQNTKHREHCFYPKEEFTNNEDLINKNLETYEKCENIKNPLKDKNYDQQLKKCLSENIRIDNSVVKNNKIATFRKLINNGATEVTKNAMWKKYLEDKENTYGKIENGEKFDGIGNARVQKKCTNEKNVKENKGKLTEKETIERTEIEKGKVENEVEQKKLIAATDISQIFSENKKTVEKEKTETKPPQKNDEVNMPEEVSKVSPFTTSLKNELEKQWEQLPSFEKNTITKEEYKKMILRKKLRGATFPETYGDRQKNCFLFIDDYLTTNEDRHNVIDEECKLRASDYNKWSVNMLYNFLKMIGLKKEAYLFKINQIRGYHILKLTDKELKNMNITNCYVRKFVLSVFRFLVNSLDNADPLSLNFNTNVKFSFDQITNIENNEVTILRKIGGGSYAQVFKARYRNKYVACKIFMYNPKELADETYCESYISTPRSSQQYILPKVKLDENFNIIEEEETGNDQKRKNTNLKNVDIEHTLQKNKKIKKMANLEIFRYFPTPVKYRNYEAKILYSLQACKYVIKLLGVCSLKEGEESIVLQYCNGGSLEKYIYADERRINMHYMKCFSRPKIVKIFQQVAEGMHSIHCNQYFHRDLKLSNILIDENEDAVISDFGLSTSFSKNDSPSVYAIYGNIYYAAPEVLKGEGFFKESDVWSFAVSFWEALSRQIAYDGHSSSEVYCKVASGELSLTIPKDLPKELSVLLKSMLDPDFTKRPLFHVIAKKLKNILESAETKLHTDIASFFEGGANQE